MQLLLATASLLGLAAALPASELIARVNNLDILIPVNGTLVRPENPEAERRAILARMSQEKSLTPRQGCPASNTPSDPDGLVGGFTCAVYCEKSLDTHFQGDAIKTSDDINCDTATCSETHADSTTISYSFSIDVGADSEQSEGETLKVGASWTWTQSATSTNTYTFSPVNGDVGHIIFRPWLTKSSGILTNYQYVDGNENNGPSCGAFIDEDPNAFGTIPNVIHSPSGDEADGTYSFCHTATGKGC